MPSFDEIMDPERAKRAAREALNDRRARHEPMIYIEDGWVVVEHGDGSIERVCKEEDYGPGMAIPILKRGLSRAKRAPAAA